MVSSDYKASKSYFDVVLIAFAILLIIGIVLITNDNTLFRKIGIYVSIAMVIAIIIEAINLSLYKYEIKENRLSVNKGILLKTNEEIDISNIVSVKMTQSVLGRVFNYGDIKLDLIGKSPMLLASISNPKGLKDALEAKMR